MSTQQLRALVAFRTRAFHLAFNRRQVNDYGEMTALDERIIDQMLQDAEEFLTAAQTLLRHDGHL